MNKFKTTFLQTYISKVRAKSFIISTLIVVLLIFLAANVDRIINLFDSSEEIATIEVEGDEAAVTQVQGMFEATETDMDIVPHEGGEAAGDTAVLKMENTDPMTFSIAAENEIPAEQMSEIDTVLGELQRTTVIQELNVTPEEAEQLGQTPEVNYDIAAEETGDAEEAEEGASAEETPDLNPLNSVIFYVTVIVMFFIIINYASQIGSEIAMEKSSRVIEMIVSSVHPVTHLMAKIAAMITVSVTQLLVFVIAVVIAIQMFDFNNLISEFGLESNELTIRVVIYSLIYLLLGLVLYLAISAMLGSFISRMEDLQQALMPVTMLSLFGFYIAIFNTFSEENMLVVITSYIPPFTPFVMPLRAMHETTGQFTLLIGVLIMIVSIALVVMLASRIYRNSVLSTDAGIMKNLKRIRKE